MSSNRPTKKEQREFNAKFGRELRHSASVVVSEMKRFCTSLHGDLWIEEKEIMQSVKNMFDDVYGKCGASMERTLEDLEAVLLRKE